MHPDSASAPAGTVARKRNTLYVQVLIGIVIGGLLGYFQPAWGVKLRPLGDAFVSLVKMLIAPIIFTTVVGEEFSGLSLSGISCPSLPL